MNRHSDPCLNFSTPRVILPGALLAAAILSGCRTQPAATEIPLPVRVVAADFHQTGQGPRYSASIVAYAQVDMFFKSSGYIDSIDQIRGADGRIRMIQQGDFVTKGTVLATVDQRDYIEKLNQAKAALAKAQAENDRAKLSFDRISTLYGQKSATLPDYDDTRAQYEATSAAVSNANAEISQAQIALDYCAVKAPMDSWIVNRNVDVGTLVGPATNGFSLVDTHLVKAAFGVPDIAMDLIRLGSHQLVTLDAVPGEFQGTITSISPAADQKTRVYSVEVTLPNPGNKLRVGMIASLELPGAAPTGSVLTVPLGAVVRPADAPQGFSVFLFEGAGDNGIARRRSIEIGDPYGNLVAVTSGLQRGDRVIIAGTTPIRDGEKVQAIP